MPVLTCWRHCYSARAPALDLVADLADGLHSDLRAIQAVGPETEPAPAIIEEARPMLRKAVEFDQ